MPLVVQNTTEILSAQDIERLWQEALAYTHHADEDVTVRFVGEEEIQWLNREWRGRDAPTNVLTFNYGAGVHDMAICLAVVKREARERSLEARHYLSLVLVHGFLHALEMDHEKSPAEAKKMSEAEQRILERAGFTAASL